MTDIEIIIQSMINNVFVTIPCKIVKIIGNIADVEPLVYQGVKLPIITHVPILSMGNNNVKLQFNSKIGDYVTVLFSQLDLSNLIGAGKSGEVVNVERFNLSNAFALPFSITTINNKHIPNLADFDIIGDVNIKGNLTVKGTINATKDIVAGITSLKTHIHGGVTSGGSITSIPK